MINPTKNHWNTPSVTDTTRGGEISNAGYAYTLEWLENAQYAWDARFSSWWFTTKVVVTSIMLFWAYLYVLLIFVPDLQGSKPSIPVLALMASPVLVIFGSLRYPFTLLDLLVKLLWLSFVVALVGGLMFLAFYNPAGS